MRLRAFGLYWHETDMPGEQTCQLPYRFDSHSAPVFEMSIGG